MDDEHWRETAAVTTGIMMIGAALFAGLALMTYSPADVLDYEAGAGVVGHTANMCGIFGARLAHHLVTLYGVGGWAATIMLLLFGALICATRSLRGLFRRGLGAVLLVVLVSTWAGTINRGNVFADGYPVGPGGLLGGAYLAPPLVDYFGPLGVYLVLTVAGLAAGMMLSQDLTESFLALLGRGTVRLSRGAAATAYEHLWQPARQFFASRPEPAAAAVSGRHTESIRLSGIRGGPGGTTEADAKSRTALLRLRTKTGASARDLPAEPALSRSRRKPGSSAARRAGVAEEAEQVDVRARPTPAEVSPQARFEAEEVVARLERERSGEDEVRGVASSRKIEGTRRLEALRQAEAAEAEREQREKEEAELRAREEQVLARLEKRRRLEDEERAKREARFAAAVEAKAKRAEAEKSRPQGRLPDDYQLPDYGVLEAKDVSPDISGDILKERAATLVQTLWDFKIGAKLAGISYGPTVTMYELELDPGIKVQRVIGLSDNLAMAMRAENGVRIIAPIPGKATIGIEIPNAEDHVVRMRPILDSSEFRSGKWTLPLVLGRDSVGRPLIADLSKMPHLLIAGTTGSGKSVCVNSIILSLLILRRPQEVKLIMVDPKQVEMTDFKGAPHLLSPVVTDMQLAAGVLTWAVKKMEDRYERMSKVGVRNLATYNKLSREERVKRLPEDLNPDDYTDPMPHIVIIVDEFADLMMTAGKEIEQAIARMAQKARAAGIHVILATQRPSADVVTGLIKTNLPCRICFQVKSKVDSRIILDQGGGDKLAGKGDMLFIPPGTSNLVRAKGVFVADHEIRAVMDFCKGQADPIYSDEIERVVAAKNKSGNDLENMERDARFDEAVEVFLALGRASTSLLQRRLGLGYTRAAKICDQMEALGIVGPDRGAKGRELLISEEGWASFQRAGTEAIKRTEQKTDDQEEEAASSPAEKAAHAFDELVEEEEDAADEDEDPDAEGTEEDEEIYEKNMVEQLDNIDGTRDKPE